MNQLTNTQLLTVLLGDMGETVAGHSLAELFGLRMMRQAANRVAEDIMAYKVPDRLLAARELLKRAMEEQMGEDAIELTSTETVKDYVRLYLAGCKEERFVMLWLDAQHKLIAAMTHFTGTLTQTSVFPRELVKAGLQMNAAAALAVHNHPSGTPTPSGSDRMITVEIKKALSLVDIKLLDHLIVGDVEVTSFAEKGLI